jgi:hypothetical protein
MPILRLLCVHHSVTRSGYFPAHLPTVSVQCGRVSVDLPDVVGLHDLLELGVDLVLGDLPVLGGVSGRSQRPTCIWTPVVTSVSTKPVESRKRAPSKPERAERAGLDDVLQVAQGLELGDVERLLVATGSIGSARPAPGRTCRCPAGPTAWRCPGTGPARTRRPGRWPRDGGDPALDRLQVVVRGWPRGGSRRGRARGCRPWRSTAPRGGSSRRPSLRQDVRRSSSPAPRGRPGPAWGCWPAWSRARPPGAAAPCGGSHRSAGTWCARRRSRWGSPTAPRTSRRVGQHRPGAGCARLRGRTCATSSHSSMMAFSAP